MEKTKLQLYIGQTVIHKRIKELASKINNARAKMASKQSF